MHCNYRNVRFLLIIIFLKFVINKRNEINLYTFPYFLLLRFIPLYESIVGKMLS